MIVGLGYSVWLSVFPVAVFLTLKTGWESYFDGEFTGLVFGLLGAIAMVPIGLIALIPWNFFCHWVWRKIGLRLPQSQRLAGHRGYFENGDGTRF